MQHGGAVLGVGHGHEGAAVERHQGAVGVDDALGARRQGHHAGAEAVVPDALPGRVQRQLPARFGGGERGHAAAAVVGRGQRGPAGQHQRQRDGQARVEQHFLLPRIARVGVLHRLPHRHHQSVFGQGVPAVVAVDAVEPAHAAERAAGAAAGRIREAGQVLAAVAQGLVLRGAGDDDALVADQGDRRVRAQVHRVVEARKIARLDAGDDDPDQLARPVEDGTRELDRPASREPALERTADEQAVLRRAGQVRADMVAVAQVESLGDAGNAREHDAAPGIGDHDIHLQLAVQVAVEFGDDGRELAGTAQPTQAQLAQRQVDRDQARADFLGKGMGQVLDVAMAFVACDVAQLVALAQHQQPDQGQGKRQEKDEPPQYPGAEICTGRPG